MSIVKTMMLGEEDGVPLHKGLNEHDANCIQTLWMALALWLVAAATGRAEIVQVYITRNLLMDASLMSPS